MIRIFIAINLASSFSYLNKKVVLLDQDLRLPVWIWV